MDNILKEIIEKIKMIPDYDLYRREDNWFRAGICECAEKAEEIIKEYISD